MAWTYSFVEQKLQHKASAIPMEGLDLRDVSHLDSCLKRKRLQLTRTTRTLSSHLKNWHKSRERIYSEH